MQIIYNPSEVNEIVLGYVQEKLNLDDSNDFQVTVTEDGTITVMVNEEVHQPVGEQIESGEKPVKRTRRTKAQIEADRQAEEDAKKAAAAAQDEKTEEAVVTETKTEQVEDPKVTPEEEEDVSLTLPDEQQAADEVVETAEPVEEQAQEKAVEQKEEEPAPRVRSLFENLRQPRNS